MSKNPIHNALAAIAYIVSITFLLDSFFSLEHQINEIFFPIIMLSLFTLSVAVMAVLFFYEPVQLFLAGKKAKAAEFLFHTIATFAAVTLLVVGGVMIYSIF
jgi:hypothetical protein